jgi:hypothetical protein
MKRRADRKLQIWFPSKRELWSEHGDTAAPHYVGSNTNISYTQRRSGISKHGSVAVGPQRWRESEACKSDKQLAQSDQVTPTRICSLNKEEIGAILTPQKRFGSPFQCTSTDTTAVFTIFVG